MRARETGVVSFLKEVLGKKKDTSWEGEGQKTQARCEGCSL